MATEKQVQANRENAQRSTGPTSPEGKERSARNSLKHGLLAQEMVLLGEAAKELTAFREGLLADLRPEGELEQFLADRVVAAAWRLRRAVRVEEEMVEGDWLSQNRSWAKDHYLFPKRPAPTAEAAAASTWRHEQAFERLARYEAHIERGFYRALRELQRLQAARGKGGTAAEPREEGRGTRREEEWPAEHTEGRETQREDAEATEPREELPAEHAEGRGSIAEAMGPREEPPAEHAKGREIVGEVTEAMRSRDTRRPRLLRPEEVIFPDTPVDEDAARAREALRHVLCSDDDPPEEA